MIMTIEQARESPLKEMFNANPAIFSIDEDAETNIMSVYVLYEKLKGNS